MIKISCLDTVSESNEVLKTSADTNQSAKTAYVPTLLIITSQVFTMWHWMAYMSEEIQALPDSLSGNIVIPNNELCISKL